jgi:putative serine protease PepD
MYKVSAKQLIGLAILSALLTGGMIFFLQRNNVISPDASMLSVEPVALADPTVATDEQNNVEIYRKFSPGVVNITSTVYQEGFYGVFPTQGSGSGSIIDQQGHILTNFHVVQGARQLEVQIEDEKFPARIIGSDRDNDLAVIKVDLPANHPITIIPLGTSQGLMVGQKVLAIGNPFGLQRTLTTGIISGLERPLRDSASRRTIQGAIQTDASINPGNSGGPLLNARGELIGINTAIYSPSGGSVGIGFAVPVDTARRIIPELITKGYVARPWLGVTMMPVDRRLARRLSLPVEQGLMVGEVYRGSGAAAASLRGSVIEESMFGGAVIREVGDIITAVDGKQVKNAEDLQNALSSKKPGDSIQLEIIRQGERATVAVRLGEVPAELR